jgi:hypothetical protein
MAATLAGEIRRCTGLAIDREQRTWQLDCAGPPGAL